MHDLIYITIGKMTKLDVTAEKEILVGVAEGILCYKIHCDMTKRNVHAHDVTFIEEPDEQLFVNDTPNAFKNQIRGTQPPIIAPPMTKFKKDKRGLKMITSAMTKVTE